jgi:hypothetical protein
MRGMHVRVLTFTFLHSLKGLDFILPTGEHTD